MQFSFNANISLVLMPLLVAMPVWAQSDPATPIQSAAVLQLKVADSDGAQVPVNSQGGKGYLVLVTDAYGVPTPDAAVALRLPDSGPTGVFPDGSHAAVAYTDTSGRAHFTGIRWSSAPGSMPLRLTATKGSAHAGLLIEQLLVSGTATADVPAPRIQAAPARLNPLPSATAAAQDPVELQSTPLQSTSLQTIPASVEGAPAVRSAIQAASVAPGVSVINSGKSAAMLSAANPSVAVTNDGFGPAYHGSKKKWIILGVAVAAAAGAAFAVSSMSKAGSSTASSSSISIGAPTVSVGHP